jgi:hypothetical protein
MSNTVFSKVRLANHQHNIVTSRNSPLLGNGLLKRVSAVTDTFVEFKALLHNRRVFPSNEYTPNNRPTVLLTTGLLLLTVTLTNDTSALSSERASHINKPATF